MEQDRHIGTPVAHPWSASHVEVVASRLRSDVFLMCCCCRMGVRHRCACMSQSVCVFDQKW
jgi:hypothetical protein